MVSPPGSPEGVRKQRPQSLMHRPDGNDSRTSMSSKHGSASKASDEETRTSVKVGRSQLRQRWLPGCVSTHRSAAVRVRPPLRKSDPGFDLIPPRYQRSVLQVTSPTSLGVESAQGRKLFIFDRVFDEDVSQRGVWEYLQDSINSFVQGYNVSILAYGQSGAGKSYTMGTSGPAEQNDPSAMGKSTLVPSAFRPLIAIHTCHFKIPQLVQFPDDCPRHCSASCLPAFRHSRW